MPSVSLVEGAIAVGTLFEDRSRWADHIWVASAWGSANSPTTGPLLDAQRRGKLEALVVGIDFDGTDPKFLRLFRMTARVRPPNGDSTFHPKIYLFSRGDRFDAIIGSSNLTRGGFERNLEANVHVSGSTNDAYFCQLNRFILAQAALGVKLTQRDLSRYEKHWQESRRSIRAGARSIRLESDAGEDVSRAVDPKLNVGWTRFVRLLRGADGAPHDIFPRRDRLSYVDAVTDVQRSFIRKRRLKGMTTEELRHVAGTRHNDRFAYFGTTSSVGNFSKLMLRSPARIDRALNNIPLGRGQAVSRTAFWAYINAFRRLARTLPRPRPSIACWSRLLAMKRPDSFLCVNGRNLPQISRAFDLRADETETPEGYWRLHEQIWTLPWCRSTPPQSSRMRSIWNARVALLDAFYYRD
jgi:hypothetical protein